MIKILTLGFGILLTTITIAQTARKTEFRVMAGPVYTTKTNQQHQGISGLTTWGYYSFDEKATTGLSFEALASFYLSKKWRLNTGISMDDKGLAVKGVMPGPADGPVHYEYRETAYYAGIPVSIERYLFGNKKMQWSVDAGFMPQWKTFSTERGKELWSNQFSVTGGVYGKFLLGNRNSILLHPVFRYSLSQIQGPLINDSKSPSFNAYSFGLEVGYAF